MSNRVNSSVERIIAKIDNDFNPDNSDWIPRTIAWTVDAMAQLDVLRVEKKRKKLVVKDKIAYSPCPIIDNDLKVFDKNNCNIDRLGNDCGCFSSPTGELHKRNNVTVEHVETGYNGHDNYDSIAITQNTYDVTEQHKVFERSYSTPRRGLHERNYILVDKNTIELSFDTEYIYIDNLELVTEYSDTYKTDIPVIPDNAILIEAITYYCMYKMLCRGMKHPVFNLAANQYGTNPYYMWTQLKDKAKASIINNSQDNTNDSRNWRSFFYNYTFPKD